MNGLTSVEKRAFLGRLLAQEIQRTTSNTERATSLDRHRDAFFALRDKYYFNYGAQGPLPRSAIAAITSYYEHHQQRGPFSVEAHLWAEREVEETRRAMAAELGATSETIALTESVSAGCNIVLWGIDWQPGDHLVTSDGENPGITAALDQVRRRFNLSVSYCRLKAPDEREDAISVVADAIRPNTRLVVLSHVLWSTGRVLPIQDIARVCRERSAGSRQIRVLVDGAQSVGMLPLDLPALGADFYAFTAHKWWCGPEGVGGLYVDSRAQDTLQPTFVGWRSLDPEDHSRGLFRYGSRRFEVGTPAYPLYSGLRATLDLHGRWAAADARFQRIRDLSGQLWRTLADLRGIIRLQETTPQAGIVVFRILGRSSSEVVQRLEARGVLVRAMADPECVRVCVHYLTLPTEIDRLALAIDGL